MNKKEIEQLLTKTIGRNSSVFSPLVGGMMNVSFIVKDSKNKKYVLYISTKQANEMVDRCLEKEHQSLIYNLGITSKNIYFDTEKGIKINEYIEGKSIDKIDKCDYKKVAALFHKLHSSNVLSKVDYKPFERFENIYEEEAKIYLKKFNKDYLSLRKFLFDNKEYLMSQNKVLCHNDGQKSNIIEDPNGEYYLIDFEFVGNNDPIYDIATFGNGKVSDGRKLLDYYFINPSSDEIKRYYLWRIYISLQWYNVAIVKHFRGEGSTHGFNFLLVANFFLNNAKTAFKNLKTENV